MGKIETKQIPSELHPSGGSLLKIMWDDKEPPKEYIWAKGEDDYWIWDGKKWIPYEFEIIKNKGCYQKKCGCITEEEMAIKFDKFKKDLLIAVSRIAKAQESIDVADIRQQLAQLNIIIHQLEEFENYYTKTEIEENYYNKTEIDQKTSELNDLTNVIDGSVTSLSRRISGMETSVSDMLASLETLNNIDHSEFITARDASVSYNINAANANANLDGYATEQYVNRALASMVNSSPETLGTLNELSDSLNNDSDLATQVITLLSQKANVSDIPEQYDDSELIARIEALENNPVTDSNVVERIETLENKPFDNYMTNADGTLIAEDLLDLDSRIAELENNAGKIESLEK